MRPEGAPITRPDLEACNSACEPRLVAAEPDTMCTLALDDERIDRLRLEG